MIQMDIKNKMTDWFKEKDGRYLTEVDAKAFFCELRSNIYRDNLTKNYGISFKNNNLPLILQAQQGNETERPNRISHIIPGKEYMLNVAKICQALPIRHKDTTLFVNTEEAFHVQRQVIDAFEVQYYTILVMVCPNNQIEEPTVKEMCDKIMKVLNTYKDKRLILIAEEENNFATQLKHVNIDCYEVITDNITFADLDETTQDEFKRKRLINFQGSIMSLDELSTPSTEVDLNEIVTTEMLSKLAQGQETEIGQELPHPDNYYISRTFNRNGQNLSEEELWRFTKEKVILISDSAGMGKSCVLTSLAVSIKKDNPHLWVVRVDLHNYTNIMGTALDGGRKSVSIIDLLNSQETSKLKSEFGKKLFTTPRRVVLMLDGLDEISPTYTALVLNLIRNSLVQVNLAKLFVTTRPHMSEDFITIPELQTLTLKPLSQLHQIQFLVKYWTYNLNLQDDVHSRCTFFAETLVNNISMWIIEGYETNFAGIPLQTRRLAEIFQEKNEIIDEEQEWEGCKEFLSSNNDEAPKLPSSLALTELYAMFQHGSPFG